MLKIALCAALACVCCMSSIPASAAELSDDDAYRYFDCLQSTIAYYGLDTSASTGENDICYYYGSCAAENYVVSCLWIGYDVYRYIFDPSTGNYSFYQDSKPCNYYSTSLGHPYIAEFYYHASDTQVQLLAGQTNNLLVHDNVSVHTDVVSFSELDTLDDLLSVIEPQEPTEAPVATAPPFTLPDEWINGGETLPAATEATFPSGFDPEDAFEQFEDITYELEEDTKSGIGFFWEFLTRIIDSLGIWNYVFFAMLFGLIVWFLKGV